MEIRRIFRAAKTGYKNLTGNPITILTYHRIGESLLENNNLVVCPKIFEQQMQAVRKYFNPKPLSIFKDKKEVQASEKKRIIISFDDAYESTFELALPILEKYEIPATIFTATKGLNQKQKKRELFWWDELEELLFFKIPQSKDIAIGPLSIFEKYRKESRKNLYHRISEYFKTKKGEPQISAAMQALRSISEERNMEKAFQSKPISLEQLKQLANSPFIEIGAHTVNHFRMANHDYETQLQEMRDSREYLETTLGKTIDAFSYPYGEKEDINKNSLRAAKNAGFYCATVSSSGVSHHKTNPFTLPRMYIQNWNQKKFITKVNRFFWLG